jgi:hypothetical protein
MFSGCTGVSPAPSRQKKLKFETMSKALKTLSVAALIGASLYGIFYWLRSKQPKMSDILTPAPEGELDTNNPIDSAASPVAQPIASGSSVMDTSSGMSGNFTNDLVPVPSENAAVIPNQVIPSDSTGSGIPTVLSDLSPAKSILTDKLKQSIDEAAASKIRIYAMEKPDTIAKSALSDLAPKKVVSTPVKKPAIQVVSRPAAVKQAVKLAPVKKNPIVRSVSALKQKKMAAADGFDYLESEFNR